MSNCGVIFDCDGTLVDSLGQALESFNYALEQVGEPRRSHAEIKRYFGAGGDRILMHLTGDEAKGRQAFEHYLDHQTQLAGQTKLHGGVRELLEQLRARGVAMAVVTGRHARDLDVVLAPHELSDFFLAMIADNHAPKSKPAPDGVLLAAKRMGLAPERTFYVGDAVYDIQAARSAGSYAVAALWDPLARLELLEVENPDFIAHAPRQVLGHLEQVFGPLG